MKKPIDIEHDIQCELTQIDTRIQLSNEEIINQEKVISYERGYKRGVEFAQSVMDNLIEFYSKELKAKDNEILSLQLQLAAQDEEYQRER